MKLAPTFVALLMTFVVILPVAPALAGMDREAAIKACRKEMRWAHMEDRQKRLPSTLSQLEACVAGKVGK